VIREEQVNDNHASNRSPAFKADFSSAMLSDWIMHVAWLLLLLSVRISQPETSSGYDYDDFSFIQGRNALSGKPV
jgi:hypothetical protein